MNEIGTRIYEIPKNQFVDNKNSFIIFFFDVKAWLVKVNTIELSNCVSNNRKLLFVEARTDQ